MVDPKQWLAARTYTTEKLDQARLILEEVRAGIPASEAVRHHPLPSGGYVAKHVLVHLYNHLVLEGEWEEDPALLLAIRMKPVRTLSGVTTVTVLTKPYPCPGNCIFCPTEECEPKSYLSDEPGARRALQNQFDPYAQVMSRLQALQAVGHPTDKIELLILGGTFTAYKCDYQAWFVERCFTAMNQSKVPALPGADDPVRELAAWQTQSIPSLDETQAKLLNSHAENIHSPHRNVGLVMETRPDEINYPQLAWLRSLGATKLQIGAQSLDDRLLQINRRGHSVNQTVLAMLRMRAAGFKVVLHWMPNLLGATPTSDAQDFAKLWGDSENIGGLCPDEIKIYPTQLLKNSELYQYYLRGEYQPYTEEQLVDLLAEIKATIPAYCRVNRVIRDIPSTNVVEGNRRTSLRLDVLLEMQRRGRTCQCIRCREVGNANVDPETLMVQDLVYQPQILAGEARSVEHFLSYNTPGNQLAGYLRLSLPADVSVQRNTELPDLTGAAIVREIHVYGQSLAVGSEQSGAAQHIGLGTELIHRAAELARQSGFERMAVISAIGTRSYYHKRGFTQGDLYQVMDLRG